jgi:hypothetical protein
MSNELFMIGDKVSYVGQKFRDRLHGKAGWIHAKVENQDGHFVVEFPDTANRKENPNDTDDYVMSVKVLARFRVSPAEAKKQEGPEVSPRRKRKEQEEE